jgi:hypothetical protein
MNDVLIKKEEELFEKFSLDPSSCEFCGDFICYNNCNDSPNFSVGEVKNIISDVDEYRKNYDKNNHKIYSKNSLRNYLMGDTSNDGILRMDDCLICYDVRGLSPIVKCSLCSKFVHYKCYKIFSKKNSYYKMKCIQCETRSLQFTKKWWQCWQCWR